MQSTCLLQQNHITDLAPQLCCAKYVPVKFRFRFRHKSGNRHPPKGMPKGDESQACGRREVQPHFKDHEPYSTPFWRNRPQKIVAGICILLHPSSTTRCAGRRRSSFQLGAASCALRGKPKSYWTQVCKLLDEVNHAFSQPE